MRRLVLFTLMIALVAGLPAYAQENLLTNGGMEQNNDEYGPYLGKGRGDLTVPEGWDLWLGQGDTSQFFNRGDQVVSFPHNGFDPSAAEGTWAFNFNGAYVQFNAALLQVVSVSPGTNLVAEAQGWLQACDFNEDEGEIKCANDPEKNARFRVGIDPNGGRDPNAPEIVWSDWQDAWDTWKSSKVEATATGGQVTMFIFTTQSTVSVRNVAYFDDAKLYAGGDGGANSGDSPDAEPEATPVPTFPPFVDFVSPQGEREDGSIVHVVGEGDTLDSIAVAYGTSRQEIIDRNPNLGSIRFLRIGQEILIREAQPTEVPATAEPTTTPIPGGLVTDEPSDGVAVAAADVEEEVAELPGADTAAEGSFSGDPNALAESDGEEASGGVFSAFSNAITNPDAAGVPADAPAEEAEMPEADAMEGMEIEDADEEAPATTVAMADDTTPEVVEDPTATPRPAVDITASTASVCVSLFEDINQNRLRESNESLLAGGTVNINQGNDTLGTYTTDGENEPHCFTDLEAGDYIAVMQPPAGFGLTTPNQLRLPLTSGTSLNIEFGAAEGLDVAVVPPPDSAEQLGNSADEVLPAETPPLTENIVAIAGIIVAALAGVVVVAGIGAAVLLRRSQ